MAQFYRSEDEFRGLLSFFLVEMCTIPVPSHFPFLIEPLREFPVHTLGLTGRGWEDK